MVLLGQREHGLREEGERLHVHRQLAGAGAEEVARDADVVAQVEQLVECEGLFADRVKPHIDLQPRALLLQRGKAGLALGANSHDAPGHGHGHTIGLKLFARGLVPLGPHLSKRDRRLVLPGREAIGIHSLPQLFDFYELRLAQLKKVLLKFRFELHAYPSRTDRFPSQIEGPTASIAAGAPHIGSLAPRNRCHNRKRRSSQLGVARIQAEFCGNQ